MLRIICRIVERICQSLGINLTKENKGTVDSACFGYIEVDKCRYRFDVGLAAGLLGVFSTCF